MPRTTRAQSAREGQSQSQSHSQDPPLIQAFGPSQAASAGQYESFVSVSTASLPSRFTICLAVKPEDHDESPQGDGNDINSHYVRGAEILADALRKGDEGKLENLRRLTRRRVRHSDEATSAPAENLERAKSAEDIKDLKVLWYTAGYAHPCSCSLASLKHAWTPPFLPPRIDELPSHQDAVGSGAFQSAAPFIGSNILDWSVNPGEDLDPGLDDLEEFVSSWTKADGTGWNGSLARPPIIKQGRDSCDDIEDEERESDLFTAVEEDNDSPVCKKRKGKARQSVDLRGRVSSQTELDDGDGDDLAGKDGSVYKDGSNGAADLEEGHLGAVRLSWDEEAKKRKQWWRHHIQTEWADAYGQVWSILPLPHSLGPCPPHPGKRAKPTVPPDYILPRYYSQSTAHPFHPSVLQYIAFNPSSRVYWAIPIAGPVLIPSYSDAINRTHPSTSSAPVPSSGTVSRSLSATNFKTSRPRPLPLVWTPELLRHLWAEFLVPLYSSPGPRPFGDIAIRLSSAKPDPFIALKPPAPLPPWGHTSADSGSRPVRPEMGDHIRVYVNAKRALALRTWLNAIQVDLAGLKGKEKGTAELGIEREGEDSRMYRPFEKVRLVLVGPRGEAMIVA